MKLNFNVSKQKIWGGKPLDAKMINLLLKLKVAKRKCSPKAVEHQIGCDIICTLATRFE